jgi:hypothetical protein
MSKRINRSLPEWVFVGSILPNVIETSVTRVDREISLINKRIFKDNLLIS